MNPITNLIRPGARGGAYHRVSDTDGRDVDADNYQTEKQAWNEIDHWAAAKRVTIAERYLDRDVSGSTMKRPELDRMLADLAAGRIDFIVLSKVDRLSRANVGTALKVVDEINDVAPGGLAILDLGLDPTTKMGEMVLTVLLALARMQWRGYQENWQDFKRSAIDRGVWIGTPPFGYEATIVGMTPKGKPVHGPLKVHETEGPIMRKAFRVAAVDGFRAAVTYLREAAPERKWTTTDTRKLFKNRAYLGELRYGKDEDGEPALFNPAAHPKLTTKAVFTAVQTEPREYRAPGEYPLTGIGRCERCGAEMIGSVTKGASGAKYRRMKCSAPCPGGNSISADKLEQLVREELASALADKTIRDSFEPVGLEDAREALEAAEGERADYLSDLEARRLAGSTEAWRAGLAARAAAVEKARERFEAIATQAARRDGLPAANELHKPEQFARALRAMVDRIVVTPSAPGSRSRVIEDRVTIVPRVVVLDGEVVAGPALAA